MIKTLRQSYPIRECSDLHEPKLLLMPSSSCSSQVNRDNNKAAIYTTSPQIIGGQSEDKLKSAGKGKNSYNSVQEVGYSSDETSAYRLDNKLT